MKGVCVAGAGTWDRNRLAGGRGAWKEGGCTHGVGGQAGRSKGD